MSFKMDTSGQQASSQASDGSGNDNTDWGALHQHIIDACKTQDKERNIPAYITGYNDLGTQPRKNYEVPYDASKAEMVKDVEEGKAEVIVKNYYDGQVRKWLNDCSVFSKPLPPRQAIAWTVTFPQIIVDLQPFFGKDSDPKPLNVIMGGEFFAVKLDGSGRKEPIVQDMTFVQENTNNPAEQWGFGITTNLHKMGKSAELLNEHGLFTKDRLGELLGKSLQFKLRIWNKPHKNDKNKSWYTQDLKFVSEVPEGLLVPELDESLIHGFNLFPAIDGKMQEGKANDPDTIKMLHKRIINTVSRAHNFEGSVLEKELKELRSAPQTPSQPSSDSNSTKAPAESKSAKKQPSAKELPKKVEAELDDNWDDDIPF